jgi:hypothetical protein
MLQSLDDLILISHSYPALKAAEEEPDRNTKKRKVHEGWKNF